MKRDITVTLSVTDFIQHLKNKGLINDEEFIKVGFSDDRQSFVALFEGKDEPIVYDPESPLEKLLNERLVEFLARNEASGRLRNNLPLAINSNLSKRKESYKDVTVGDLLQFKIEDLSLSRFRNVGQKCISELLKYLRKENLPDNFPLIRSAVNF